MYTKLSVEQFISELSSPAPYPGGGSAACLVGTLGISLALMVGRILQKKRRKGDPHKQLGRVRRCLTKLSSLKRCALRSVDGDVRVYQKVVRAYALKKGRRGRMEKIERALRGGYLFQKNFGLMLIQAGKWVKILERNSEGSIASDLLLSKHFLRASFLSACQTAKINLEYMKDRNFKKRELKVLTSLTRQWR